MNKEFIPYEEAVELKVLGFDESCFGYYISLGDNKENPFKLIEIQSEKGQFEWTDNVYYAPLYQQAFRWFRDNHLLVGEVFTQIKPSNKFMYGFKIAGSDKILDGFNSYEDAELECLKKLIEIVKKK